MLGKTIDVHFIIDANAFAETQTKKVSNVTLVVEYENPQAYGYPEVCAWNKEYEFSKFMIDELRRKVSELGDE